MIHCLKIDCKNCGELFPANESKAAKIHKESCHSKYPTNKILLSEVYSINVNSSIPKEFEDAALHSFFLYLLKTTSRTLVDKNIHKSHCQLLS